MMPARMRAALARRTAEVYEEESCCCDGKPCGDGTPVFVTRYPTTQEDIDPAAWKQQGGVARDQFAAYARGERETSDEPFTYAGTRLGAFAWVHSPARSAGTRTGSLSLTCFHRHGRRPPFPSTTLATTLAPSSLTLADPSVASHARRSFGAGHVVLRGDGTLQKWCVRNQVRSEALPLDCQPACFFGVSAGEQAFVLASPETYTAERCGLPSNKPAHVSPSSVARLKALPGVRSLSVVGRYPTADVSYDIPGLPVEVSFTALSPMVPLDTKSSSLPLALFRFTVKNTSDQKQPVRLLQSQQNFIGWDGQADCTQPSTPFWAKNVNTPFAGADGSAGLAMSSGSVDASSANSGTLCVTALARDGAPPISVLTGAASETELWANFIARKEVPVTSSSVPPPTAPSATGRSYCGGVVQSLELAAGETATLTFVLAWHFPNRMRDESVRGSKAWDQILPARLGNHYATQFKDASAVAEYARTHAEYLVSTTVDYVEAMYSSSIPWKLTDSAAGRAAVLRSPTMWQSEAGIVHGTEGNGCCPLNCTHVYGYTTLMERLYPDLAMDMRTYAHENSNPSQHALSLTCDCFPRATGPTLCATTSRGPA